MHHPTQRQPVQHQRTPQRRTRRLFVAVAAIAMITSVSILPASAAVTADPEPSASAATASGSAVPQPICGITWGSTAKRGTPARYTTAPITNLRAGRHQCFDRLVIDLGPRQPTPSGQALGYRVRYVNEVRESGSGDRVDIAGGAYLMITANAPAHDADYRPTYTPRNRLRAVPVAGFSTFRQVAFLGTFEGQTDIALGVRARLPMRAMVLAGPGNGSRLVIDVAHRW